MFSVKRLLAPRSTSQLDCPRKPTSSCVADSLIIICVLLVILLLIISVSHLHIVSIHLSPITTQLCTRDSNIHKGQGDDYLGVLIVSYSLLISSIPSNSLLPPYISPMFYHLPSPSRRSLPLFLRSKYPWSNYV